MNDRTRLLAVLWTDLEHTLNHLGTYGGLMSPSVYDTAQCLRYNPPSNPWPAVSWLIEQQRKDGGWSTPTAPRARYMPTLAAILALVSLHPKRKSTLAAIQGGLDFIRRRQWDDWATLGDDLPGGVELILPLLLNHARDVKLPIDLEPYAALVALGKQRSTYIQTQTLSHLAGTTAAHGWEGWGEQPDPAFVDGSKTVGHSPTASAVWLSKARSDPNLHDICGHVEAGLQAAWAATTTTIEGVFTTCWPITHFERTFALYPLLLAGFFNPSAASWIPLSTRAVIDRQITHLHAAITPKGLGFTDWFLADGDDTAVATAILAAYDHAVSPKTLMRFKSPHSNHFCAWQGELQSSPSVTAHALHALALLQHDEPLAGYQNYLLKQQLPSGLWAGEKWNISTIYTTSQIMIGLMQSGRVDVIPALCQSLVLFQHPNGAWGMDELSAEETSYAVLALLMAKQAHLLPEELYPTLTQAKDWMCTEYRPFDPNGVPLWLGKEAYRPLRVSRSFEIVGLIALLQEEGV
ncbi:MAG: hypothetical protein H0T53_03225 [Herpetosiphonaceae bacterium]|nr:hypothetical protein [Herpetosiphonaceae bacterium]